MRRLRWSAAALVLLLAACSDGVEGTYADEKNQNNTYTFDDGKVTIATPFGTKGVFPYTVEDDAVRIVLNEKFGATMSLKRQKDGSLSDPIGARLVKR